MTQQLVMTPQLQQAIKLLQLSRAELSELVRDELLENPLLEESEELGNSREDPVTSLELQDGVDHINHDREIEAGPVELNPNSTKTDDPEASNIDNFDWGSYLEGQSLAGAMPSSGVRSDEELPGVEQTMAHPETFFEHLMWQVRLSNFSAVEEDIAEFLLGSVSPSGYLMGSSPWQMADQIGYSPFLVEQVLRKIQMLDPISIASRTLAEALWIQARNPDAPVDDPLVQTIIAKHLPNLEKRAYAAIVKDTGEPLEEVYEATKLIRELEPRPARAFVSEQPQYVTPDVYVQKMGSEYVVTLNDDGLPKLKISGIYRSAIHNSGDARDYITERLRSAQWLIRSIQQRQRTIMRVMKSILKFQRDFFEKGAQHLRPLILKDVAEDIEMHESTVSRVTTNKYVHTPQGIFELKYFFNAGISREGGEELASEAVKHRIKQLIDSEDQAHPYSDQKLVQLLAEDGINIARRTVAKYREQLNVLSSSKRRKLF